MNEYRPKIGLALGSGSSRGWAHIGVIKALEENNINIDFVAGTSAGAFVGAIYSSGALESLEKFVRKMDGKSVFSVKNFVFSRSGLFDIKAVEENFSRHSKAKTFKDLKIPLKMVATDLETGEKVVLDSGDLIKSIAASSCFPGVFEPVTLRNRHLIDGGIVDPVPIDIVRAMGADIVIAVDLNTGLVKKSMELIGKQFCKTPFFKEEEVEENMVQIEEKKEHEKNFLHKKFSELFRKKEAKKPNFLEIIDTSVSIMQERITRINLAVDPPDILIRPGLGDFKMLDYDQVDRAITTGYNQTIERMEKLKRFIDGVG